MKLIEKLILSAIDEKSKIDVSFISDRFKEIPVNLNIGNSYCSINIDKSNNNTVYVCEVSNGRCEYVWMNYKCLAGYSTYEFRLDQHHMLYPIAYVDVNFLRKLIKIKIGK